MNIKLLLSKYFEPKIKDIGCNNTVSIGDNVFLRKAKFNIYGNNNKIIVDDYAYLHNITITIGFPDCPIDNCIIRIGRGTSCNSLVIQMGESDSEVIIGENCMISFNVEISCTDTHSITDMDGNLTNIGEKIEIGSNVWICKNVTILKNSKVPSHSIVAQGSIVTKKFDEENIAIAGNPAKIVKNGIKWDRKRPQQVLNSTQTL